MSCGKLASLGSLVVVCMAFGAFAQGPENVALQGTATVSAYGYGWVPERAIDGNYGTGSHSAEALAGEWLEIALDQPYDLTRIRLVNRADCCSERILGNIIIVMDADRNVLYTSDPISEGDAPGSLHTFDNDGAGFAGASIIRVEQTADAFVQIMEVEAFLPYPYAYNPSPVDGADEFIEPPTLAWAAADGAIAYNVYVSDDAVIDDADLVGTIAETELALTEPLVPGATTYWRVDAADAGLNTHEGPVWQFTAMPVEAHFPSPANGAVWQATDVQLNWVAGLDALVHNVFFSTDMALVEAKDPSVQVGQWLSDASFDPGPLDAATTYYWAVDEFLGASTNPGPVWSLTTIDPDIDMNVNNWAAVAGSAAPAYQAVHVADGVYDIGALSGDITYEFIVISDPCETQASMALIGRRQFGDTEAGLKYEQWNNTGTYGATLFGVVDLDFGVPTAPGEYTHLAFVSSEDAATTTLYVNGAEAGAVDRAITLSGMVGIGYGAQGADMSGSFDDFDGSIFGVAIYDEALDPGIIEKNANAFLSPIAITDPDLLIHYTFEAGAGPIVIDRSGHGNAAEFFGTPEWTSGIDGGGLAFNRDEVDYIQTKAPLGITSNNITVSGWAIHDETPQGWSGILTHRGSGNLGLQHNGMETGAAELRYMWGPDLYWSFSSGLLIPNGEWYFAALAIGPDQGKLYLNGANVTATNVAPHDPVNFDSLIRVARDHTDGRIMTCTLDDVRLYNKTLTDAEIAMLAGTPYVEDFESYAAGTDLHGVNDWEGWEGTAGAGAPVSDAQAVSGANSVDIIGTADLVKKLDITGGKITLSALQYIPAGGSGDTYFILMNQYAPNPLDWSSQTKFNLGTGQINDGQATIVADEWVELMYVIDLDNNTVEEYYNGAMFNSGQWDNDGHNTLQAIDLYSAGASSVYYDDITIEVTLMPVGLWKFDEGDGDVAADSSGNNNDGTITDATWVEGLDGGALDMAGVGYVQVPAEAWMSVENEMTVAFWAYGDPAVMPQSHTVFAAYSDPNNNNARIASAHIPWGNGNVYFDTGGTPESGGYDRIWAAATAEEQAGAWRHWAFVKDAVTGDQQIYLDGVLWHSGTGLTRPMAGVTAFTIGARNNGGEIYPGIVDDFRLYDQALSGIQIYRLANP